MINPTKMWSSGSCWCVPGLIKVWPTLWDITVSSQSHHSKLLFTARAAGSWHYVMVYFRPSVIDMFVCLFLEVHRSAVCIFKLIFRDVNAGRLSHFALKFSHLTFKFHKMILYSKDTKSDPSVNLWINFSTQKCCLLVLLVRKALLLNSKRNILQHFIIILL